MKRNSNRNILARAAGVAAMAIMIAGGVTFAALQSQPVKLTGNTIETATAGLQISTDDINFTSSHGGFDFAGLVPGTASNNNYKFYLHNSGNAPLALKFAVSSVPLNPDNIDLSKVQVIVTPDSTGTPQSFSLESLVSANNTGGLALTAPAQLFSGNTASFTIQVTIDSDAVVNSSADLGNIDFAITGIA